MGLGQTNYNEFMSSQFILCCVKNKLLLTIKLYDIRSSLINRKISGYLRKTPGCISPGGMTQVTRPIIHIATTDCDGDRSLGFATS